jgi:hypothetical protein
MRRRVLASVRGDAARLGTRGSGGRRLLARAGLPGFGLSLLAAAALGGATMLLIVEARHSGVGVAPPQAGARALLRRLGPRAELIVSGMSEPPPGEVYELWLERTGRVPSPTDALFTVTNAGAGTVEVPGGLRGVSSVMVTREPRGGSATPSSPAVLRVPVQRGS